MKAVIIINFKTYKQGGEVLRLAKKIEKISKEIIIGLQPTDIFRVSRKVKLPVYSQHADYFEKGRNTGFILPEAVKINGGKGVFLNHSEHKLKIKILKKTIERCNEVRLKTAVFAGSLREAKKIKKMNPDYLIIEPPELVGGRISVSTAKPFLIKKLSRKLGRDFIVGAGIKTNKDIKTALNLGARGVALSSVITKSKNPEKIMKKLFRDIV